jgi:hypothetical protein
MARIVAPAHEKTVNGVPRTIAAAKPVEIEGFSGQSGKKYLRLSL